MAATRTGNKSKKKSTQKKASTVTKNKTNINKNENKELMAILLFMFGIFLLFIVFMEGSSVWKLLHDIIFGLFGVVAYIVPEIFIISGIMIAKDKEDTLYARHRVWQIIILISLLCAALQIFVIGEPRGKSLVYKLSLLYTDGVNKTGGGVAGALVGWPLTSLFGKSGASVTVILGMILFVLLATGSTLMDFFKTLKKPVDKVNVAYNNHVTKRSQAVLEKLEQEKSNPNFNIDIDLGPPKKDTLPDHPVTSKKLTKKDIRIKKNIDIPIEEVVEEINIADLSKQSNSKPIPDIFINTRAAEKIKAINLINSNLDSEVKKVKAKVKQDKNSEEFDQKQVQELINKAIFDEKTQEINTSNGEISNSTSQIWEDDDLIFTKKNYNANDKEKIDKLFNADDHSSSDKNESYNYPALDLLSDPKRTIDADAGDELMQNAELLVDTLKSFGVHTKILDISRGPMVTRYELQPSAGVKISKITSLADDIALNLATAGVRIEAPIPNKAAVGIEVPNKSQSIVNIKEIINSGKFVSSKSKLSVAMGKDISGEIVIADIAKMPHVLIAGATGSGKSVCINTIIISILYKSSPEDVRLLMIDPKVVELGIYNGIPHLLVPVVTDPRKAAGALNWAVTEMLKRYKLFADNQVRDIRGYNKLAEQMDDMKTLPQIVIIIDELADLMMAAPNEVEDAICRLAQMARAAGMHLVIATQRPSVDVITGVIKANIPSRIAFAVSSSIDSRTILDGSGAEKLLGRGDMLFAPSGSLKASRVQGCFVDDKEVERVVKYIKEGMKADYDNHVIDEIERQAVEEKKKPNSSVDSDNDEMFPSAVECVLEMGQASTSLLQRKLKLGYARAARIMDVMEQQRIVGPSEGSKPRQVLINRQQWSDMNGDGDI